MKYTEWKLLRIGRFVVKLCYYPNYWRIGLSAWRLAIGPLLLTSESWQPRDYKTLQDKGVVKGFVSLPPSTDDVIAAFKR